MKVNVNLQGKDKIKGFRAHQSAWSIVDVFVTIVFRKFSNFFATVHNSNSQKLNTLIRIPVYQNIDNVVVTDAKGKLVKYQVYLFCNQIQGASK